MRLFRFKFLLVFATFWSFGTYSQDFFLQNLLSKDTSKVVVKVLNNPEKYKFQIIYTQYARGISLDSFSTTTYTYRNKPHEYFYPASMVKLPCAAFAIEKINKIGRKDIGLTTPFKPLGNYKCFNNTSYLKYQKPLSLASLINKLFAVSDNDAYNVIYDLLGQKYIHRRLAAMGYDSARIIQKFTSCSPAANRVSGPIAFYQNQKQILRLPAQEYDSLLQIPLSNTTLGSGHYSAAKFKNYGIDFKFSNYLSLNTLHYMLMAIVEPKLVSFSQRFELKKSDRLFLRQAMSKFPKDLPEKKFHNLDKYPNGFVKYIGFGNSNSPLDSNVNIVNKVGEFYGYLTDCSYIENKTKGVAFFISAVVYVNDNDIINDGVYEYKSVGIPFLHRLGQLLYQYELNRPNARTTK